MKKYKKTDKWYKSIKDKSKYERNREIADKYVGKGLGMTMDELVKEYGISQQRISDILKSLSIVQ